MSESAPARQRSPWFYVLLGCGGLALALIGVCLAGGAFAVNSGKNMAAGVTDAKTRTQNAVQQLGAIPDGYSVVASVVLPFGAGSQTMLTDQPVDEDAGLRGIPQLEGRLFVFKTQLMDKGQLAALVDDFQGKSAGAGGPMPMLHLDEKQVLKRSEVAFEGKKAHLLVTRGPAPDPQVSIAGLAASLLMDCPEGGFKLATWIQKDPAPEKKNDELSLTGTVADEAELAKFLKPMRLCGK
jgi:hypothetical protein